HRCDRPRCRPCRQRIPPPAADAGTAARRARVHTRAGRRRSRDPRLDVAVLSDDVLVVNAGSTSLKLSVVALDETSRPVQSFDDAGAVLAVGHRIVHGGDRFSAPVVIDDAVQAELERLVELAPLHNTPALDALDAARAALPGLPHVAVFDTAFHRRIPPVAATY